jgi:hypothetical protein
MSAPAKPILSACPPFSDPAWIELFLIEASKPAPRLVAGCETRIAYILPYFPPQHYVSISSTNAWQSSEEEEAAKE